jgi:hypothetical protein
LAETAINRRASERANSLSLGNNTFTTFCGSKRIPCGYNLFRVTSFVSRSVRFLSRCLATSLSIKYGDLLLTAGPAVRYPRCPSLETSFTWLISILQFSSCTFELQPYTKMATTLFSWLPSLPYPPEQDGYWSPVTSTLDWCEEVRTSTRVF